MRERIKTIPEEKLCEPEPYAAIPAIQQLSYCENSEILRDLYANLLASSMNIDTKWSVHPSFVDIIKQLNPDEAKLLRSLPPLLIVYHPLINVKMKNKENKGSYILIKYFTTTGLNIIENKNNICSYVENLERLKLIDIPPLQHLTDEAKYNELKENHILNGWINASNIREHFDVEYENKIFNLTNYGIEFLNITGNKVMK